MVADNNYDGIYLELSNGNTVASNTVANNNWEGIFLDSSSDNTFTKNSVSNNTRYDFYSAEHSHNNTVEDLLLCDYPTTVSFTYDNGVGLKSVDTAPSGPSDKMDISKYVDATKVCADSWLFLNVSYDEADLGNVAEDSCMLILRSSI
jgi:parallel beta-helix repeat protein